MRRVVRSQHLWIGLALFTVFCVVAGQLPIQVELIVTNCLYLVGSLAVGIAYLPTAIRAIRNDATPQIQHIALGIVYAWGFGALWRIWSLIWLTSGQQPWFVNNDIVATFQSGVFLGACYHLTSPGAAANSVGGRVLAVALVVLAALGLAALVLLVRPDTSAFVEALKPYIPR